MLKLLATIILLLFGYSQAQDANCDYAQNSTSCSTDSLLISRSGDPQLTSAQYYRGTGTVSALSTGRAVGLNTSKSSPGGYSRQLTAQADSSTPTCGCGLLIEKLVIGGENAEPNEFPMMAGIIYVEESVIKCGGAIISRNDIVTAAHCVVNRNAGTLGVVVGEHDISAPSSTRKVFKVASLLVHPQYTPSNHDYDIAILILDKEITFSTIVGPVCLPFKFINDDFDGVTVTILGWGTLFPGGPKPNILQKVKVHVISQETCIKSYPDLTPRQLCTYRSGMDACQDDSGGPLLYKDPDTGFIFLAGTVSYGRLCGTSGPGVNSRTTALLDWIVDNAVADYCRI